MHQTHTIRRLELEQWLSEKKAECQKAMQQASKEQDHKTEQFHAVRWATLRDVEDQIDRM